MITSYGTYLDAEIVYRREQVMKDFAAAGGRRRRRTRMGWGRRTDPAAGTAVVPTAATSTVAAPGRPSVPAQRPLPAAHAATGAAGTIDHDQRSGVNA